MSPDKKEPKFTEKRISAHRYKDGRTREVWDNERREAEGKIYAKLRPHLERFLDEERAQEKEAEGVRRRSKYDLSEVFAKM